MTIMMGDVAHPAASMDTRRCFAGLKLFFYVTFFPALAFSGPGGEFRPISTTLLFFLYAVKSRAREKLCRTRMLPARTFDIKMVYWET